MPPNVLFKNIPFNFLVIYYTLHVYASLKLCFRKAFNNSRHYNKTVKQVY